MHPHTALSRQSSKETNYHQQFCVGICTELRRNPSTSGSDCTSLKWFTSYSLWWKDEIRMAQWYQTHSTCSGLK